MFRKKLDKPVMKHACEQSSFLASKSMNDKLTLKEWFKLRFHMLMCKACTNYKKNIETIEYGLKALSKKGLVGSKLSQDRKDKIKSMISNKQL